MLSPDSRTVAFDLLRPPAGHELDLAVLTTYTLDLEAQLVLPLSLIARTDREVTDLLAQPLSLLEALRRAGDRIHVFVDRAGIAVPRQRRDLYAMLESSIHPVRAPGGGAFHPKVWVLRFISDDGPPLLRVAILSRNLTFDRSWDIALATEASPEGSPKAPPKRKKRYAGSAPLADLIRHLPDLCRKTPGTERLDPLVTGRVEELADQIARTRFPAPDGFAEEPVAFHALGLDGKFTNGNLWRPMSGGDDVLAVAPFVGVTALDAAARTGDGQRTLVSTQDQLDRLAKDPRSQWDRILVLSDSALDEAEDDQLGAPSGLHAKFIAVEHGRDVSWCVGSANLTASAFSGRNVEVMAVVTARRGSGGGDSGGKSGDRTSGYGIARFLDPKSGFGQLCEEYERGETPPKCCELVEAQKHLEAVRDALLDAKLRVVCKRTGENWIWSLEGKHSLPKNDSEVTVTAWPVSLAEDQAKRFKPPMTWTLPIQRLTALVAFRLKAPVKDVDDLTFTLRLPARGMPADRVHHVLKSLIDDPEKFMAFLRALLVGLDSMTYGVEPEPPNGKVGSLVTGLDDDFLLEGLLRTAARDPERLEPVRRLIADLLKTEDGRCIVPPDVLAVWNAVEGALRKDGRP